MRTEKRIFHLAHLLLIVVLTLLLFAPAAIQAQEEGGTDTLFQQANSRYEEGAYEEALVIYQEVIERGMESALLYYNMGNAAYRSNSIGYAVLYYEKALKLDPTMDNAEHNLEFVSRYRPDKFEEVPRFFLGEWINGFVHTLPEQTWSILAMLFFVLLLAGFLVFLFSGHLAVRKTGFIAALTGLFFFVISFTSALSRHSEIVTPDEGVILAPSVVVRSSPSETGTELFILHEGTKIEVNEEVSDWQNIRVIDGREGWIGAGDFETI